MEGEEPMGQEPQWGVEGKNQRDEKVAWPRAGIEWKEKRRNNSDGETDGELWYIWENCATDDGYAANVDRGTRQVQSKGESRKERRARKTAQRMVTRRDATMHCNGATQQEVATQRDGMMTGGRAGAKLRSKDDETRQAPQKYVSELQRECLTDMNGAMQREVPTQ